MSRNYNVIIKPPDADGLYVAFVPALPGCHTQARSLDELTTNGSRKQLLCIWKSRASLPKLSTSSASNGSRSCHEQVAGLDWQAGRRCTRTRIP